MEPVIGFDKWKTIKNVVNYALALQYGEQRPGASFLYIKGGCKNASNKSGAAVAQDYRCQAGFKPIGLKLIKKNQFKPK